MEVKEKILTKNKMPFCPGCGHAVNTRSISKAIQNLGYRPKDITIVSDIGCSGLIDPLFNTHTIHGLHGRAPALGVGVSLGLDQKNKKVIVVQGDGGVTIGLQHILEAARRNIDLTLVIYNNLLYGMTGGQMSGLSTNQFKDLKNSSDDAVPYDIVNLAHQAGAAFSVRVNEIKRYTEIIEEAIEIPGFSLVELSSLCTAHGMKKVAEFKNFIVQEEKLLLERPIGVCIASENPSLFESLDFFTSDYKSTVKNTIGVVIAGSAGGGVQSAAKLLAEAGILSGLHATMKGEYPITVGTGFSAAEVILSKYPIHFTGLEHPDVALVVSDDGWKKVKDRISDNTLVLLDSNIVSDTNFKVKPFIKMAGKRGAALSAIAYWIRTSRVLPIESLLKVVESHKHKESLTQSVTSSENM